MSIKIIDAELLKKKLDDQEDLILVDVREAEEWHAGRIPGAVFKPLSNFEEEVKSLESYKNKQVILQCRSGARSMRAAQYMESLGFTDLTNLAGGILGWNDLGYKIITD